MKTIEEVIVRLTEIVVWAEQKQSAVMAILSIVQQEQGWLSPEAEQGIAEYLGMPAMAVTDLGNLFGLVKFYTGARGKGVKPIIGADIFLEPELPGSGQSASRLLQDPLVAARYKQLIEEKHKALHMEVDEILARAAMLARSSPLALFDENGKPLPPREPPGFFRRLMNMLGF